MAQQYVRITQEAAYNAFNTNPGTGQQINLFLPDNDAYTVRPDPNFWVITDAGVGNRMVRRGVGYTEPKGQIKTLLFPSQAAELLTLAASIGAGPCYNLPTFTCDNRIVRRIDCGSEFRRVTGCMVSKLVVAADQSDNGYKWSADIDVIGSTPSVITATDFPLQTLSTYPSENPYLFGQASGNLTIGTARTMFRSLRVTIDNQVSALRGEAPYPMEMGWFGRSVMLEAELVYKTQADRLSFEQGAPMTVSLTLNTGTKSVTFAFGGNCEFSAVDDSLPLNDYATQKLTLMAMMDPTATPPTDLTITTT